MENTDGWDRYQIYVVRKLESLSGANKEQFKRLRGIEVSLVELRTELKLKAGIWGALAGAIPVLVVIAIWMLKVQIIK